MRHSTRARSCVCSHAGVQHTLLRPPLCVACVAGGALTCLPGAQLGLHRHARVGLRRKHCGAPARSGHAMCAHCVRIERALCAHCVRIVYVFRNRP
jgi:hypothetical protein